MLSRSLPVVLAAVVLPVVLPAGAHAAARPMPKIAGVSTPQDAYLVGSGAPAKVRIAPGPRKAGSLKVTRDGRLIAKVKLGKGAGALTRTVRVPLPQIGIVTIKACVRTACKAKKVRVYAPSGPAVPDASPKSYHLVLVGGSVEATTVGTRAPDSTTYCGGHGFTLHGRHTRTATLAGASAVEGENVLTVNPDGTISGRVLANAPAQDSWPTLQGCMADPNGGGVVACDTTHSYTDGGEQLGFSFESTPGDRSTVTVTWSLPQPEVGFVDIGDEVCNVSTLAQYFSEAKIITVVPRDTFLTDAAKTLSISGAETFDRDYTGNPAHIDASFKQTVQFKRVP